jgi:hypothetical protein
MGGLIALERGYGQQHNVTWMLSEVLSHRWAEQEEASKVYEGTAFGLPLVQNIEEILRRADVELDTVTRCITGKGELYLSTF